jgi:hypothetical protein
MRGVGHGRQHDGGHTDAPAIKYFIPWAGNFIGRAPPQKDA